MAKFIIVTIAFLLLAGCITTPDLTTGAGCWRYGVTEQNTGRMTTTPIEQIPIVVVKYADLYGYCGVDPKEALLHGCYQPLMDTIYIHRGAGRRTVYEEQCHALLGTEHNNCYPHYGIGKDESACGWNAP